MLIARIYETFPLACPDCGATMRVVAFITETAPVHQILNHIGEPHEPPPIQPPREPPDWIDPQEQVFLDEDLNQDRYEIDKSSGQKLCTATGRPQGGAQGCAPCLRSAADLVAPHNGTDAEWFHRTAEHLSCRLQDFLSYTTPPTRLRVLPNDPYGP